MNGNPVFTIGHSNHQAETFLALARQHGLQAMADVRSAPYSRFSPQFNREVLARFLEENGIHYVFLGRELGARTEDRSCYEDGRVQYTRLAQTMPFRTGLERVRQGAKRMRIALMCSEKEPLECHRTLLVSRALAELGESVLHIHADGRLESHGAALERLLDLTKVPKQDLFCSHEELVARAIAKQEKRVAFESEEAAEILKEGSR